MRRRGACERADKCVGKRHAEVAGASERQDYRRGKDKIYFTYKIHRFTNRKKYVVRKHVGISMDHFIFFYTFYYPLGLKVV